MSDASRTVISTREDVWQTIKTMPPLVRIREVERKLGINRDTIKHLESEGKLRIVKTGKTVRSWYVPKRALVSLLGPAATLDTIEVATEAWGCVFGPNHDLTVAMQFRGRLVCANCAAEMVAALVPLGKSVLRQPVPDSIRNALRSVKECSYCGKRLRGDNRVIDHILPYSLGGTNEKSNLAVVCKRCNAEKRDMTLFEWTVQLEEEYEQLRNRETKSAKERCRWMENVLANISKLDAPR